MKNLILKRCCLWVVSLVFLALIVSGCTGLLGSIIDGVAPENSRQIVERNGTNIQFQVVNSTMTVINPLSVDFSAALVYPGPNCDNGQYHFDISSNIAKLKDRAYWESLTYTANVEPNYFSCGNPLRCTVIDPTYEEVPGFGVYIFMECLPI